MSFKKRPLGLAVASAMAASMIYAGDAAAQAQSRERIEVTGTNIKRTDTETPSVVQVITREQIERSGATSVAELLREIPAVAGGSAQDFDAGSGFQRGNQTASLRGLGSVATLLLVNGRRVSPAPYADPNVGQGTSFNLNSIPLSAVDRIEILKDGASAVYGSEAIAGVVNIILRKDYRGAEVALSHWQKSGGEYKVNQASVAAGMGDLSRDRWNVLIAGEWLKREPQRLAESGSGVFNADYARLTGRNTATSAISYPANVRRESAPGSGAFLASGRLPVDPRCPEALRVVVVAASGLQECRFNNFDYLNIVSELERKGVLARGSFQVAASLTAFAEVSFTRNDATFVSQPPGLDAAAPSTWFNREGQRFSYTLILPVGHPDNPNAFRIGLRYRFADIGQTRTLVQTDATRVVAGVEGTFGTWDWNSGFLFSKSERTETSNIILYYPAVQAAVNNGTYRFSGTNSQALLNSLHPDFTNTGESTLASWDIKGSRELMQMPGGPAMMAAGFELRREKMDIVSDPRTVAGEYLGVASSTVHGSRNVASTFVELSMPVVRNVETQIAGRYDRYSDFGSAFTPKLGAKWLVTPALAARGTWAKGFRAPSLFQISNANVQSFNAGIVDPLRCPGGTLAPGAEAEDCNRTISSLIQANTNVQPEKSVSHTLGLVWSPSNDFQTSIDYWYIHRMNFIDRFSSPFVIQQNFNGVPAFANAVIRNPNPATWLPGIANSGPIQSTIRRFDNFGDQVAAGWDLDISYRMLLGSMGKLRLDTNWTYYDKNMWQFAKGANYFNGAGNFYAFESPRVRGNASAIWDFRDFSTLVRYNYVGRWNYGDPESGCYLATTGATFQYLGECYVKEWGTYDLGVSYKGIRNLEFGVLVRNVKDTPAPYDPNQPTLGFNPTHHNPYGRYWQFSLSYKFK
ncbi:MAG TPA: TonB-dependent receptor [Usitatibacter sp.]|nr:TonB-dependent receptor [Usitatibacter sp.]